MTNATNETPIRVGVFNSLAEADRAVDGLLAAGFNPRHVTVVCSDQAAKEHFAQYEHQEPAGSTTPTATVVGGAIGAALGGLAAVAGVAATGGVALLAAGGIAAWGGAAVGGLIGAMMSRGVEKELANFYDQAVGEGKIIVAVEDHRARGLARLAEAESILADAGAQPVALRKG